MQKKMKSLIISIFLIISLLTITANAALTFDNNSWYILVSNSATNSTAWEQILEFPKNIVVKSGQSVPSTSKPHDLYILFQANHIITADDIIVIQVALQGLKNINVSGVGTITSSKYLPPKSFLESNINTTLIPNQTIIATTIADIGYDTKRISITFRAGTFSNNYVFAKFSDLTREGVNVTLTEIDLYDSVEDAAGSGTTPEEMREVLSSWGEEELIPGIGQAVGDKIEEVVPDAILDGMDEHDNQLKTEGNSAIDNIKQQIGETITPYFENTDQIRDAIHGGASGIFGYAGTDAVITLPAARNPLTGNSLMWNEYQIDLGMYYNRLPAVLRQLISALLTMLISIGMIRELLDTVNTILIHRELLGMPDDHLKSWTRRDG